MALNSGLWTRYLDDVCEAAQSKSRGVPELSSPSGSGTGGAAVIWALLYRLWPYKWPGIALSETAGRFSTLRDGRKSVHRMHWKEESNEIRLQ